MKASIYRSGDVFLLPGTIGTLACYPEACAFGLPTVTTRLHHSEDFVTDGVSGYLIDAPLSGWSDDYGSRWQTWADFDAEVQLMRETGQLDTLVEDIVDRIEPMIAGDVDVDELRRGARRVHAERCAPEVRNAKLMKIYTRALER